MTFNDLNLIKPILKALQEKNYHEPTAIQEKAIPHILNRKDILATAQTGTGKTAAFALPMIQMINEHDNPGNSKPKIRGLILSPTRELALQIEENIKFYSKHTDIKHTVIFGGVKQHKQVERLKRGVHILVATPGRLLDLMNQGYVRLSDLKFFVLDEADRMLDMGFINDIKKIIKAIPQKRQTLFFSATMPDNIVQLSRSILTNPVKIEVDPVSSTAELIQQYLYYTNKDQKNDLLLHILDDHDIDQVLLFTRTKRGADKISKRLKSNRISSESIHGDKAQNQRQRALDSFKAGKVRVLVATDIAARGIDIQEMNFVINYDTPENPETYVHRIGRTGRAGSEGVAISMCEPEENSYIRDIEKLTNKKIERISDHPYPQTDKPMTAAEKKEWNKEKERRKQAFFANRKNSRSRSNASR
jgi:ATP-dependent RNA helicase RhlE